MTTDAAPARTSLGAVGLADVVRYAGASGDLTALHYDPAFAKAAGHERLFSMGLLHGGWLLSHLVEQAPPVDRLGGYRVTLTFQGIAYLDEELAVTVERTESGATGTLTAAGRPAALGSVDWAPAAATPVEGEDPREAVLVVEQGAVNRFATAVRWPDASVPATFVATVAWVVDGDPFERLGLDRTRTLAAGTTITYNGGPLQVGETLTVREVVANRRSKQGKAGEMEFADLVTEFHDTSGLRASYVNTFVQLPAAQEQAEDQAEEPRLGADFRLVGSHDSQTGETYYPVRELSVDGRLRTLEEVELSPTGTLYAFTNFMGQDYGQIDLPEGVRVQAPLAPGEHTIGSSYSITSPDGKAWCFARA